MASGPMKILVVSVVLLWAAMQGTAAIAQTIVDDSDSSVVYSLGSNITTPTINWYYLRGTANDYNGTEHSINTVRRGPSTAWQGPSVSITFMGTSITWYGKTGPNYGKAKVSLENGSGGSPSVTFDAYSQTEQDEHPNVTMTAPAGVHVLTITLLDETDGSDYWQTIDYFAIVGGGPLPLSQGSVTGYYQWNSGALSFDFLGGPSCPYGGASNINCYGYLASDLSGGQFWTDTTGNSITWKFSGNLAEIYGRPDAENGYFGVAIDGVNYGPIDENYGSVDDDSNNAVLVFAAQLPAGNHTLVVTNLGYSDGNYIYSSNMLQIDEFVAFTVSGGGPPPPQQQPPPPPPQQPPVSCQYQVAPQGPANQVPVSLSASNGAGDSWDSGLILWGGGSQVILYETSAGNPSQSFTWTQKSPGYTVCSNNAGHLCLSNSSGNLVQTQTGDIFQILAGSKPTTAYVLDVTACSYIGLPSASSGVGLLIGAAPTDWVAK